MKTFRSIVYMPYENIILTGDDRYTQTLQYQPTEYILSLYKQFLEEKREGNPQNLTSESKPVGAYFLYSLIKENHFTKVLQIGARNGIESLYIDEALRNSVSDVSDVSKPKFDIIMDEEYWNHNFEKYAFRKLKTKNKTWFKDEACIKLPQLLEGGMKYDMIVFKGDFLFDDALIEIFYSDKLLEVGGILYIRVDKFESLDKLVKYIDTNYKHFQMFPKNFGSETTATFIKLGEDTRQWFFHAKF
jgi:hypothetical protein